MKNLVLNYSDFSFISDIAVGFNYAYFATSNGVTRYNFTAGRWDDPLTGIDGFSDEYVHAVEASFDDENVWIRTDEGVFKYSATFDRWIPEGSLPTDQSGGRHIFVDDNYFAPWGYTYMSGGALTDKQGRIFQIVDIFEDEFFHHWMGIWGLGAAIADATDRKIKLLKYGLLQKNVSIIFPDEDKLWITGPVEESFRSGFTILDPEYNEFEYLETHGSLIGTPLNVYDIRAYENKIFAATDDGVWVIDRETREIVNHLKKDYGFSDDRIISLEIIGDTLFTGTQYGLGVSSLNPDTFDLTAKTLLDSRIITCLKKTEEALWIGSDSGAYRYKLNTGKLERFSSPEISRLYYVTDIEIDNKKAWFVFDGQLVSLNLTNADIDLHLNIQNNGRVSNIAVKDTIIAVAADAGLLLIYEGNIKQTRLFTTDDGILSHEINCLLFDDEYLWLGSNRGLSRFWYKHPSVF